MVLVLFIPRIFVLKVINVNALCKTTFTSKYHKYKVECTYLYFYRLFIIILVSTNFTLLHCCSLVIGVISFETNFKCTILV